MSSFDFMSDSQNQLQTVFINGNKISTLIPNRIFVGGFPQDTTEDELKKFFMRYGDIRDVKIIPDKVGQSKGNYGFVTFENQDIAEKIITEQAECLIFRDRKLNIGRAVKKQPLVGKSEVQSPVVVNPFSMGYNSFYPYQDYSYLLNQDLSSLYQSYAHFLPGLSMMPQYPMLSPFVAAAAAAATSTTPVTADSTSVYQHQLQSIAPVSLATQIIPSSTGVTPLSGFTSPSQVANSGNSDPVTISSVFQSYGVISSNTSSSNNVPVTNNSNSTNTTDCSARELDDENKEKLRINKISSEWNLTSSGSSSNDDYDVPRKRVKVENKENDYTC